MSGTVLGTEDSEETRNCTCYCHLQFDRGREDLKKVVTYGQLGWREVDSDIPVWAELRNSILWTSTYNAGKEVGEEAVIEDPVLYAVTEFSLYPRSKRKIIK